ncbi:hypothetical protein VQL36_15895 [Chengkuizengella sp. SCS-71B]|uniref:hypothetical protein n=1 Tax=Chengkuizengella sp. SCS-71B TaxID=3115290 RepID=UPI0032C2495E
MPEVTPNLGIKKPLGNENVSRESFNENWDIIDEKSATKEELEISGENAKSYVDQKLIAENISIKDEDGDFSSENVEGALSELFQSVSDGKTTLAAAITDMGQSALGQYTFAQLAAAIRNISDDATTSTENVLTGTTFYQGGLKKTGSMPNQGEVELTPSTSNQTISKGYHNGSGYVKGDVDLKSENIKKGVSLFGVNGASDVVDTGDATAGASNILTDKTAYVNGSKITGTMTNRGSVAITPGTSKKSIASGYHSGSGYVVGDADLTAANIKKGKNIFGVAGSFTSDATAGASNILTGKTAYVNGSKITGTMTNRGSVAITPGTSKKSIASGYHSGSGYVVGDVDLIAANIKKGKNIFGVAGSFTSDATATASDIVSGKTAYVNGNKIVGTSNRKRTATGKFNLDIGYSQSDEVTISNLPFRPTVVLISGGSTLARSPFGESEVIGGEAVLTNSEIFMKTITLVVETGKYWDGGAAFPKYEDLSFSGYPTINGFYFEHEGASATEFRDKKVEFNWVAIE